MVVRSYPLFAATLILCATAFAQTPAAQTPEPQAPEPGPNATVLQANTQIVVLDVVVQDAAGNPVHGLKPSNFQLVEGKTPQLIRHADEHTPPPASARLPDIGKLPPGTFTNYTPVPPGSALNVLLLDALNTPMMYQTWVRDQLKKYVNTAPAGQRIAIFGLTDHLILLQGFTSDPDVLKNIIDHKLTPRASSLLNDPAGTGTDTNFANAVAGTPAAASVRQFEAEANAIQAEQRIQATLDAFNALAHYLSGFPGRKNLLWFSGSFPTGVFAGPTDPRLLNADDNINEIKETTAAFTRAQVAVYPIDARGLMTDPAFNPANTSPGLTTPNARAIRNDINAFSTSQAEEHATMETLADETGGHAFYNTNGITQAIGEAINAGSNYYTLTYSPTDHDWNGKFRSIKVTLIDAPSGLKLSYRPGYYAEPPKQPRKMDTAALATGLADTDPHHDLTYDRAALARGGPTPQDVVFKVRVLPASNVLETKLAPGNTLDPAIPAPGPYHRYDIDFGLLPTELTLAKDANGVHTGQVKFTVYVYNPEGKLLVAAHRGFNLNLKPDLYEKFIKAAVQCHMEISVPDKVEGFLRLAVQDVPSDRFGVVEIPANAVDKLPPPSYGAPPPPKH
jgi:VWFA-related protein